MEKGSIQLTGKITGENHPFIKDFLFVKLFEELDAKGEDISQAYRTFFQEIYAAGCRTIQLDDCTWGMIVDSDYWKAKVGNGFTLEQEALQYLR